MRLISHTVHAHLIQLGVIIVIMVIIIIVIIITIIITYAPAMLNYE